MQEELVVEEKKARQLAEAERKKQEEERKKEEEKLRIEKQLDEIESYAVENINLYLEIVNRELLENQGEIESYRDWANPEDLQISSKLTWEKSREGYYTERGKRLWLITHANRKVEVIAGNNWESPTVIDTKKRNWQERLQGTLLSKLSSKEELSYSYYHEPYRDDTKPWT